MEDKMRDHFKDMQERHAEILRGFDLQFKAVLDITKFDSEYISSVIGLLEDLKRDLARVGYENPMLSPWKAIRMLEVLRDRGPEQQKYAPVYNQSIVLLVSYFSSAITDIFNDSLTVFLTERETISSEVCREKIEISISELSDFEYDLTKEIGRVIARKSDISFQDMQSICKAFKRFFGFEIPRDRAVNNIITAQALRHVIVHNSEVVDRKCLGQIRSAVDRGLKLNIREGEKIGFCSSEIELVGESMSAYIKNVGKLVEDAW